MATGREETVCEPVVSQRVSEQARQAMYEENLAIGGHYEPWQPTRAALIAGIAALDALLARVGELEAELQDWRLTVWEYLVTDLTDDGTTSAGYTLTDIPHDVLRGYVVDVSGAEARVEALQEALRTIAESHAYDHSVDGPGAEGTTPYEWARRVARAVLFHGGREMTAGESRSAPESRVYHPDPEINAEIQAQAREGELADLAAGYAPKFWRCECGAGHSRGHFLTVGVHRCLACGYVGEGGTMHTHDAAWRLI